MTIYYFCDNGTGADGGCVPGNDTTNTGLSSSSPWRTLSKFVSIANSAAAGDQFLFSKGGAWNSFSALLRTTTSGGLSVYAANPIIIKSYSPTQFSSSAPPRLNCPAGTSGNPVDSGAAFRFTYNGSTTPYGGYDISEFLIDGGTTNEFNSGLTVWNIASYINFHDNTVQNTMGFVGCSGANAPTVPTNITIKNNAMTDCLGMGIVSWGCQDVLIEGNVLTRAANRTTINQAAKSFDHAMYVSGDASTTTTRDSYNVVIRGNTCTDSCFGSTDNPTRCCGTVIVGHSRCRNWTIENNLIKNSTQSSGTGWGIQITPGNFDPGQPEYMYQLTIRGNRIINCGGVSIDIQGAALAVVENNAIVQEFAGGGYVGIRQRNSGWGLSIANSQNTYRNNSIYFANSNSTDTCFGLDISGIGSGGHVVAGNMVVYGGAGTFKSFADTDIAASGFTAWNNNLGFGQTTWGNGFATPAAWAASRSGQDGSSISGNPSLVATPSAANNANMRVQSGSPAIDAGNATYKSPKAIDGYPPVGARDIGAYEFGSNP